MVTMRNPMEKMRSRLPMMIVPVLVDHLKQQLSTMAISVFCYKRFASKKLLFIRFKTIVQTIFQTCQEKKYSICSCFTALVFSRSHEPFPFLSHKRELTDWARFQSNKFPPQLNLNSNRTIFFSNANCRCSVCTIKKCPASYFTPSLRYTVKPQIWQFEGKKFSQYSLVIS
jgi:hypothetical protein